MNCRWLWATKEGSHGSRDGLCVLPLPAPASLASSPKSPLSVTSARPTALISGSPSCSPLHTGTCCWRARGLAPAGLQRHAGPSPRLCPRTPPGAAAAALRGFPVPPPLQSLVLRWPPTCRRAPDVEAAAAGGPGHRKAQRPRARAQHARAKTARGNRAF